MQYKPEAILPLDGPYAGIAAAVNAEGVAVGHDGFMLWSGNVPETGGYG